MKQISPASDMRIDELRRRLPDMKLLTDEIDRESYRRDETTHYEPGLPLAVALPRTTSQVSEIVTWAAQHHVPVVARGAGSGLSGGSAGIEGALTVAFTAMDSIIEIDEANMLAVVQPGVINADLKKAVGRKQLFYPPDPGSYEYCTIGGNIGTNAGGLCCIKYGVTRQSVLGLEVVLADGSVIRTGGKNVKDVAGYALTDLFVGSQGTLGLVTEAILRLRPATPPKTTMLAFFPSLISCGAAVAAVTAARLLPCTLELMDRHTIRAINDWHNLGLDPNAAAVLLIESDLPGISAEEEIDRAAEVCERAGATEIVKATDAIEADWLRQVRRLAFRAMERLGVSRMEDVGVPRALVPVLLGEIERIAREFDLMCGTFGHAGDGNLHPTFVWQRGDAESEERAHRACEELYRVAIRLGGTITGEHGIGSARLPFLEAQSGPGALQVMHAIKSALDPHGILNPGRAVGIPAVRNPV
jgi:glycolate oxidase